MNYVLPFQQSREVKTLVQRRGRQVVDEVLQQVEICARQSLGQSGYLTWTSVEGQNWAVFENGRCHWLLQVDSQRERVCYYRYRGDLEYFELHEPGHAGSVISQEVEQIGQLIHSYNCVSECKAAQIERKIRWWQMQRWFQQVKYNVCSGRSFPSWLVSRRTAA